MIIIIIIIIIIIKIIIITTTTIIILTIIVIIIIITIIIKDLPSEKLLLLACIQKSFSRVKSIKSIFTENIAPNSEIENNFFLTNHSLCFKKR